MRQLAKPDDSKYVLTLIQLFYNAMSAYCFIDTHHMSIKGYFKRVDKVEKKKKAGRGCQVKI